MNNWNSLKKKPLRALAIYFAMIGAVAGVASWALVTLGHMAFGSEGPGIVALLFATLRGSVFGVIFAVILFVLGRKNSGGNK